MRRIISTICLALATVLFCAPAMAYTGENWLNTDIDGMVTEATPEARPQDDFNLAVNRDYILNLTIPEGSTSSGGFFDVGHTVKQMRLEAIKDDALTGHDAELVRQYYDWLMDWETRDSLGVEPAMSYLNALRAIDSLEAMTAWFADRNRGGITAYTNLAGNGGDTGSLFAYRVEVSRDDPGTRVLNLLPIRLSLSDSAEYSALSENGKITKARLTASWTALLDHLGIAADEAARMIDNTFALEGLLAAHKMDLEASNNPANLASRWNPTDLAGVEAMCGAFPAREILKGWGLDQVNCYNVAEPDYMKALEGVYTEENLALLRDWLTVRTASWWADYLDRATRDDVRAAENAVLGIQGAESDEITAMGIVFDDLSIPADNLYIAKYCTPRLRDDIHEIIDAMVAEYRRMLAEENWLTEATREKAIEKLDNLTIRSVYPQDPEPWDGLEFEPGSNLLDAAYVAWRYGQDQNLSKVNAPVDKSEWDRSIMPVSTANAFYYPADNSINILAGILNDVIYQSDYSYEEKLGFIGVIIGHEISHAFDPMGSQYDKDGRLASWWTDEDRTAFNARAKKLVDYYDDLKMFDDIQYSGNLVQGEAVADMGGMKCALHIAAGMDDFDYHRFFESYARLWACRSVKSRVISRAKMDSHPLGYLRCNVTVMQFDEFQRAYDVNEGDDMYVAPEDRICVW